MRRMAVHDEELFHLERLVIARMLQSGCPAAAAAAAQQQQLARGHSSAERISAGDEERSEATEVSVSSSV